MASQRTALGSSSAAAQPTRRGCALASRSGTRAGRCAAADPRRSADPAEPPPAGAPSWRKACCRAAAAAALAAALAIGPAAAPPPPALAAGQAGVTPFDEGKSIRLGPTADGRVRPCGINPNCVSSANLDDLYGPPWRSPDAKPPAAAAVLEAAVAAAVPASELARASTLEDGAEYRAWTVPSFFGDDVMEFVLRTDAPLSASAAAPEASSAGVLVTYRSQAGSLKFLYPLTQPLPDGGVQKKRLDAVRRELGWRAEGCSYLECYLE